MIFSRKKTVPEVSMERVNLLLADDHQDTADLLMFKTKSLGWTGTWVTSASAIIQAMNECENCYDAIIADVNFFDNQSGPRLTGITAIREIRKVRPNIPVIFITGFSNSLIREEIRRVNADLMTKPFDIDALFDRVYQLIYWYRLATMKETHTERRGSSVNQTEFHRRTSDQKIGYPSPTITNILSELRDEAKEDKI